MRGHRLPRLPKLSLDYGRASMSCLTLSSPGRYSTRWRPPPFTLVEGQPAPIRAGHAQPTTSVAAFAQYGLNFRNGTLCQLGGCQRD